MVYSGVLRVRRSGKDFESTVRALISRQAPLLLIAGGCTAVGLLLALYQERGSKNQPKAVLNALDTIARSARSAPVDAQRVIEGVRDDGMVTPQP